MLARYLAIVLSSRMSLIFRLSESLSFESLVPVGLEKAMVLLQSLTPDDIAEIQRQTTTKAEILFSILNQKQTNQPG